MGWKIFTHSVRMVLDNLGVALRISLVLYLVQIANQLLIFSSVAPDGSAVGANAGLLLILSILAVIASLWVAVGWHRFVLTGEEPRGFLPQWHGGEILGYFGRSVMIGLILGLGIAVVAGLGMAVVQAVPGLAGLLVFGLVGLASYLFFRIGLILPAAAMGEKLTLRDSWTATGKDDKALLVLALIVMGARFLIELPGMIDGDTGTAVSLIYSIVLNWFVMMFGVSVLTSLYGYFIEGRRID